MERLFFSLRLIFLIKLFCRGLSAINLQIAADPNAEKTLILLGFSGLRWDSIAAGHMTVLNTLARKGVLVVHKQSAFQTETLPAFQSIITGLYPESHGLVSNRIRDMSDGSIFTVGNKDLRWWGAADPLWVSHEKRNPNQTALCFWPGYDVKYGNVSVKHVCPMVINGTHYVNPFHELATKGTVSGKTLPLEKRFRFISDWLSQKDRPRLIAAYFEEPFQTATVHGATSKEYLESLSKIDFLLASFVKDLERKKLFDKLNIVITGESGATEPLTGKDIYLEDYLPDNLKESFDMVDNNGIATLIPHNLADVLTLYSKFNHSNENMVVYTKTTLPDQFHLNHKTRTMPLTLVAKEGWRIHSKRVKNPQDKRKAFMGYAGFNPSTRALFVALGPAFKKGATIDAMNNVDVYQLLCHALQLDPNPHNGSGYVHTKLTAKLETWYWHIAKTVVHSTTGLTTVIIISLCLFILSMYALINLLYLARARCSCPRRRAIPQQRRKQPYRDSHREGVKHLLSDEEELSGSDLELGSDLDSDFEIKHVQS